MNNDWLDWFIPLLIYVVIPISAIGGFLYAVGSVVRTSEETRLRDVCARVAWHTAITAGQLAGEAAERACLSGHGLSGEKSKP